MKKLYVNQTDSRNSFSSSDEIGTFKAAVGAIILDEQNRMLLTQRTAENEINPGTWEVVFGRVNQGEGFEEALYREIKEEVDLTVEPISVVGVFHFLRLGIEYVGVMFLCKATSTKVAPLKSEIMDTQWVDFDTALSLVPPYVQSHIMQAQEVLNSYDK